MSKVKKLICGVGFNDIDHTSYNCLYYTKWHGMIRRCYSKESETKNPTYKDCYVCDEWLTFSNFKSWMEQQDYDGKHLDKDLLVCNNKVYSPETCCFVTKEVNSFLTKRQNHRGNYPIGVNKHYSGFYYARISSKNRTMKHLGSFNNPLKAHRAWQLSKIKRTKELIETQTDNLIVEGLYRVYYKIIADFIDYKETIDY